MTDESGNKSGEQFDSSRFKEAQQYRDYLEQIYTDVFGAKNVVPTEPDEEYDNFIDEKAIHQLLDYSAIDYVVDTFDDPLFGINHRTHKNSSATRFDIRASTGTSMPSELHKLEAAGRGDIVPKVASRMKVIDGDVQWVRLIDLIPFVDAEGDSVPVDFVWKGNTSGVVAKMYDYDDLREQNLLIAEIFPQQ